MTDDAVVDRLTRAIAAGDLGEIAALVSEYVLVHPASCGREAALALLGGLVPGMSGPSGGGAGLGFRVEGGEVVEIWQRAD